MRSALLTAILLIGWTSAMSTADQLSTTRDGALQALAQSPHSIALYWRHEGRQTQVCVNGQPAGDLTPANGSFTCRVFSDLKPNTAYTFSVDNVSVTESTWSELPARGEFGLLVIGGTASGTAAAVCAARLGLSVALVEETNRLGGVASNGLGSTDIRNVSRSNGFFDDFRLRVIDFYSGGNGLKYEPRVANALMKSMVYEQPRITRFLRTKAVQPIMEGCKVLGAVVQDCATGREGQVFARVTIDATDTADFAASAGAQWRVGREPRSQSEPHAGVIYFDDATQEILPGSTGEGDRRQQSYAYLMVWKDYGEAGAPIIEKPRFYDPQLFANSPDWPETWNATAGKLTDHKFEINQHPFGIDWPGINHDYPTAAESRRREIEEMYRDRALGYLYYMQTERGHTNLGLAEDEFLDNCSFPVSLYIRESRRVMGECIFQEADVSKAREFYRPDSIGIGDYPMDSHATEELRDPTRRDKGEGEFWLVGSTPWYQIPYQVMVPRGLQGLLVTTAVSATHVGYGTLRMEPVRMSLGQAAAAAAYYSVLHGIEPRDVSPALIQDKLLSQKAYITWYSDVNRDTRHFKAVQFLGARGMFPGEAFKPDDPLTRADAVSALSRLLELEGSKERFATSAPSPDPVTRAEFAQMLVHAKQRVSPDWQCMTPACPSYSDVPTTSPYYAAIETLHAHRITALLFENTPPGEFLPSAPITRADAAEAIYLAHRDSNE